MHWCLAAVGDWLQGPYVYALYEYYGFTVKDIGRLFIAGFGSSMVFGTIVGSLADKQWVRTRMSESAEAVAWLQILAVPGFALAGTGPRLWQWCTACPHKD